MKLLQRLRTMGPSVEPSADQERAEALPGLSRDDFLDPPAEEAFEPVLSHTETQHAPRGDASQR